MTTTASAPLAIDRTLADAAGAEQVDPTAVADELLAVVDPTGADIDALDPASLADHILETHHAYLHEELPHLVALATKVLNVHGRHPREQRAVPRRHRRGTMT